MKTWQMILLALTVPTEGNAGNAVSIVCLIILVAALLFQKLMTNRDPNDFGME